MEIIIRIYDRERLLEAKLQSGETCTIGKAAGCTIQPVSYTHLTLPTNSRV